MSTLWIREYRDRATAGGREVQIVKEPGVDQTPLTFSASAASAAFAASTSFIGMISDVAFHFVVAASPTATTSALKVPANTLVHIGVTPGQKIAAIAAA